MSGNSQQTAEKLAAELGAQTIRIEPVKEYPSKGFKKFLWGGKSAVMGERPALQLYRFDGDFDTVIFGAPVWASNIAPPMRTFIVENRDKLSGKRLAAFVCCSGGGADKALAKLKALLEVKALTAEMILIDPKDKPSPENEEKIRDFCKKIKGIQ